MATHSLARIPSELSRPTCPFLALALTLATADDKFERRRRTNERTALQKQRQSNITKQPQPTRMDRAPIRLDGSIYTIDWRMNEFWLASLAEEAPRQRRRRRRRRWRRKRKRKRKKAAEEEGSIGVGADKGADKSRLVRASQFICLFVCSARARSALPFQPASQRTRPTTFTDYCTERLSANY